jgi:prophage regulatory protein
MSVILRLPSVKNKTGLGRSTIYLLISRGDFPKPISLGARAVGFLEHEIDAWVSARVEQSRGKKVDVTSPAIHGDANTSAEPVAEPRRIGRMGSPGLHRRPGLGLGRSPNP